MILCSRGKFFLWCSSFPPETSAPGSPRNYLNTLVLLGSKQSSVLYPGRAELSFHWQANHRTNGAVGYTYHMRRETLRMNVGSVTKCLIQVDSCHVSFHSDIWVFFDLKRLVWTLHLEASGVSAHWRCHVRSSHRFSRSSTTGGTSDRGHCWRFVAQLFLRVGRIYGKVYWDWDVTQPKPPWSTAICWIFEEFEQQVEHLQMNLSSKKWGETNPEGILSWCIYVLL